MQFFPAALQNLADQFARLPGIGGKTAQRLAYFILSMPEERLKPVLADLSEVLARHPIGPAVMNAQPLTHRVWLLLAGKFLKQTCRLRNCLKIGL